MDVNSLADQLPRVEGGAFPVGNSAVGLEFFGDVRRDFIPPDLAEVDGSDPGAGAVLIQAAAAAGKTTCAKAIAARSGAPLVDLAGLRVGFADFQGIPAVALGMGAAARFFELLEGNKAAIVLDALDETSLLSGQDNLHAFVQGICQALRESKGVGNVVMLSRMDTAEWVVETFREEGVPLRRLSLEYFSKAQAEDYLDRKLDRLYGDSRLAHRVHVKPYSDVREMVFERIAKSLGTEEPDYWSVDTVRRFLGYSPVLDAIASYLCVPNFGELNVRISDGAATVSDSVAEWRILRKLTEDLLVREKDKFLEGWSYEATVPRTEFNGHVLAYTPLEQCIRLLNLVEGRSTKVDLPAALPAVLKESYRRRVEKQIYEHPFISTKNDYVNSIFRDYMYALVLSNQIIDGVGCGVVEKLRKRQAGTLPSPALAPFIVELVQSSPTNTFPANRCDLLIGSLSARRDGVLNYEYSIDADDQGGELEVRREAPDGGSTVARIPLQVVGLNLCLPSHCRELSVDYAGPVDLVSPGQVVVLGPAVSIRSGLVTVEAASLKVESTEARPVSIESELVSSTYPLSVQTFGDGPFSVIGTQVEGPLLDYRTPRILEEVDGLDEYFYSLRRVLLRFRSTVHLGTTKRLSANRAQLERYVTRRDPKAERIVACLVDMRILSTDGDSFVLDIKALNDAGINHASVRNLQGTSDISSFLQKQVIAGATD
jgi:hypothetical protein